MRAWTRPAQRERLQQRDPKTERAWRHGIERRLHALLQRAEEFQEEAPGQPDAADLYGQAADLYTQAADLALDAGWSSVLRAVRGGFARKAVAYRRAAKRMRERATIPGAYAHTYIPKLRYWPKDKNGSPFLVTTVGTFHIWPLLRLADPETASAVHLMFISFYGGSFGGKQSHFIDRYGQDRTPSGVSIGGEHAFQRPESAVVAARHFFKRFMRQMKRATEARWGQADE